MFGFIGGLARCAGGRHERSDEHIRKDGDTYYSKCRYCRTKLRRVAKRQWVVA